MKAGFMLWKRHQTQLLVALGLLLNISAALLSNLWIDEIGLEAKLLQQQQQQNQALINQTWQQASTLENKRELLFSLLNQTHSTQQRVPDAIQHALRAELNYWQPGRQLPKLSLSNLASYTAFINDTQQQLREQIDNYYLSNLRLHEQHQDLEQQISRLRNLALFLQIFGLGLILARDLSPMHT